MGIKSNIERSDKIEIYDIWEHPSGRMCMICTMDAFNLDTGEYEPAYYTVYVQTTLDHEEIDDNVQVHWGITYGPDNSGWIGFDMNHPGDVCLDEDGVELPACMTEAAAGRGHPDIETVAWRPRDVREAAESLAEQLEEIESES